MNVRRAEQARSELPSLLDAAEQGKSTIITRHGEPVAVLVPFDVSPAAPKQKSLLALAGTGRGLWGRSSTTTLRKLRDEWSR